MYKSLQSKVSNDIERNVYLYKNWKKYLNAKLGEIFKCKIGRNINAKLGEI